VGSVTGELLDTTVIIDHLNGIRAATEVILRSETPGISVITWIEVLAGLRDASSEAQGRMLLSTLELFPLSDIVAEEVVRVRRERRLKLPDAMIWATARVHGLTLVTRNTKDLPASDPSVRVPYTV
jgi:predicted nucleic acid-binding protein